MQLPPAGLHDVGQVDFCIIGAGPAGITCALKLASPRSRVLLLEAGDLHISAESQQIYEGEVVGDDYFSLDVTRLRFFGGSSNHWGGWCRPLDEIDFQGKDLAGLGRWPIKKSDLDPFLHEASQILEIAPNYRELLLNSQLKQITFEFSPPVRFGKKYYEQIVRSNFIFLCLRANVVQLETDGTNIQSLLVRDHNNVSYKVRAGRYILACGGIENSRLLLWSNYLANGQLVKSNSLGRYWFEHPHFTIGEALINTEFGLPSQLYNNVLMQFFAPTEETIRNKSILNCGLRLQKSGGEVKKLIRHIACVAPDWADWAYGRFRQGKLCASALRAAWEQEPTYANHVALGKAKDPLGIPRVELNWRKSELDRHTVMTMAKIFGAYLATSNNGRLRLSPWLLNDEPYPLNDELAGSHHMGGTRMGIDPNSAVVDANCRVFDQGNLYVAGSSVFPSGGHANPTFTIIQLALRLSDHLKSRSF